MLAIDNDQSFDVAILDMKMPDIDGGTLAQTIRQKFTKDELPMIMITSLGQSLPKEQRALFNAHLTNPVKPSTLFNTFMGLFSNSETAVNNPDKAQLFDQHPRRTIPTTHLSCRRQRY